MADALSVQQDIVEQISNKLEAKLSNAQKTQMARGNTDNPQAYDLYLKGRYYAAKFDSQDLNKGLDYFQQAIALDPNYALAYDGLSYYYQLVEGIKRSPREVMPKAREAAQKALAIDDSIAESHVELGTVYLFYDFDWAGAERELKRAIELDPNYAPAHEYYSWYLVSMGRADQALAESRHAEELDPLSSEISSLTAWWLYLARRYDESITQAKKCLDLNPSYTVCLEMLGNAYNEQGRYPEAIEAERKVRQIDPSETEALAEFGRAFALWGHHAEAQHALNELLNLSKSSYVSTYSLATLYAALGDKTHALTELEQEYTERSYYLDHLKSDPEFDSLRSEPRFRAVLQKLNFPH